jgi:hypothetical protein
MSVPKVEGKDFNDVAVPKSQFMVRAMDTPFDMSFFVPTKTNGPCF